MRQIAILSRLSECYSTRRLVEEAVRRGHRTQVIAPDHCTLKLTTSQPGIYYQGEVLGHIDALLPRFGTTINLHGIAVVRQCEIMQIAVLNSAASITLARDKVRTLQLLMQHGLAVPTTGFGYLPEDIDDLLDLAGTMPVVIKLVEGMKGMGVMLAESRTAARSLIEALQGLRAQVMVQEFIQEAAGMDLRCLVIDGQVVAAMQRQARAGEFRANLNRGGQAGPVELTSVERELAARAATLVGLDVAGVDLLRSSRGPLVLEVNASPGLEGIEAVSGENIAGRMIALVEQKCLRAPNVMLLKSINNEDKSIQII